ncbi:Flp pilus assembly protein CpaB [Ruegeria denitrificans]|uniref:Flp pilus assembly protein CpaB n=1 Tax=Ruegeria denitrificans TaxID=1715692 RepID=A0A0P1IC91_9RHOB|nr:Flp pilus assembly protein CpaB [Ruegeria denitrificans]CUK04820.1 Flp pilus assembly protein CpaB [Ruegeria denitrificans]
MRAVFGLVLIAGLALAGGAVYLARDYIAQHQAQLARERLAAQQALENAALEGTTGVLVSNRAMKYGERLAKEDVRVVNWPDEAIPEGTFVDMAVLFPEDAKGDRFVLRAMEKDEALMVVKLTNPGEAAGLTSRIAKGKRAFAISVDVASGVSGFLRPGDSVDVYWTGTVSRNLEGGGSEITRLIQTNIELVAIDQSAGSDLTGTTIARTVTVAATPEQIAALAQAQNTGRLSLALVGVQDDTIASAVEVDQRKLLGIKEAAPAPVQVQERKCYTKVRRSGEIVQTEIPCTN